jgi:hypothetical protein
VDEVLARLAAEGYAQVEEIHTAAENLVFALPRELRRKQ